MALVLGCAGVAPLERRYRISELRSTKAPDLAGGAATVHLGDGLEYTVEATLASGVVTLRVFIRNRGRDSVQYDIESMVVVGADGAPLRMMGAEVFEQTAATELTRERFFTRLLSIGAGRRYAIVRRYEPVDGMRRGRDLLLLARLSASDVVRAAGREAPVRLRLDEVR
jgi:hypothetical protein